MIVVIVGPDVATARAETVRLLQTHDPAGQASSRLDGRVVPSKEIVQAISSVVPRNRANNHPPATTPPMTSPTDHRST
jgi:hypothetical protein